MKNILFLFLTLSIVVTNVHANHIYHKRNGCDRTPFYTKEPKPPKPPLISRGRNYLLPVAMTAAGVAVGAALAVKEDAACELANLGDLQFSFEWSAVSLSEVRFLILLPDGSLFQTFTLTAPPTDNTTSNVITGVKSGEVYTVRVTAVIGGVGGETFTMSALLNGISIETKQAGPPTPGEEFTFIIP